MKSLQGHLLASDRGLTDPNFFQAVVLMVQHDAQGAMGIVLNRPSDARVAALWKKMNAGPCRHAGVLYHGGPCEGPVMALHDDPRLADSTILDGVYFASDREAINELLAKERSLLKIFAGYAGWSDGQLEAELEEGSWLTTPAKREHFAIDESELWKRVTGEIVGAALIRAANVRHVPNDLRLN